MKGTTLSMIEVKNLTKYYGPHLAVDNISFQVGEGEIVGFLGPNGAGKSTTLRILTCYQPASGGAASVAGFDVFTQSMEVRRVIGYLPEGNPLYPEMRVREYLNFRGKLRGMSRDRRAAALGAARQRAPRAAWAAGSGGRARGGRCSAACCRCSNFLCRAPSRITPFQPDTLGSLQPARALKPAARRCSQNTAFTPTSAVSNC